MQRHTKTKKKRINKRRTIIRMGGKAGKLRKLIYIDEEKSDVIGAGNFGIAVTNDNYIVKLFYDLIACNEMKKEANIQNKAYEILKGIVYVPKIYEIFDHLTSYKGKYYLCGIKMERVPIIKPYGAVLHIPLGYKQYDVDRLWSKDYRNDVSESNPPRGYYPSIETLEDEFSEYNESVTENNKLTIEKVAYIMGIALRKLIDNGIIPYDLEWVYGGNGKIYLIDFGMCSFGHVDPKRHLESRTSGSLGVDYYIPGEGHRGREEFLLGYYGK